LLGDTLAAVSPHASGLAVAARSAALAAAAFDYAENFFLLHVLAHFDSRPTTSARFAAIFTTAKMIAFVIAATALISAWISA
ncbi:MAG TPA: hypothetical protein VKE42_01630, partial [Candidatus Cybelea sp.]|nr:hypothetical protein [Candidatus Cybelea sp.]